jgi:hypothetical protein
MVGRIINGSYNKREPSISICKLTQRQTQNETRMHCGLVITLRANNEAPRGNKDYKSLTPSRSLPLHAFARARARDRQTAGRERERERERIM